MGQGQRLQDARRVAAATTTFGGVARRVRRRRAVGDPWRPALAEELRHAFEHLGPTYTKLGQMMASTPGLFPDYLVDGMQGCLDQVKPLPVTAVRQVISRELGAPAEELYGRFDPVPLASASIGQVHRATTIDGAEVVVKVQRPGITHRIDTDLRFMASAARLTERISTRARLVQPVATVADFDQTLRGELSFMIEARSMEEVAAALADFEGVDRIRIPQVHWRYTTPRVLTMEYVEGYRLDDVDAHARAGVDGAALLKTTVQGWLHGTLVHGVFHGDLHAGNLCVDDQGRVCFIDFGICGRLSDEARRALFVALPALLARDYKSLARALFVPLEHDPAFDLDAVVADLERTISPVLDAPLGDVSYATAFVEVVRVGLRHGVLLPKDLILVFKQFFYVERFTTALAPHWQPLNDPELMAQVMAAVAAAPPDAS
jgi:predicted unusual protein kinase regulating ubiquinone biosynthesis (AarF/ABC1/UbiB family)